MRARRPSLPSGLLAALLLCAPLQDATARYGAGDYASRDQLPAHSPLLRAADAALVLFLTSDYDSPAHTALDVTPVGLCPGNAVAAQDDLRIPAPSCSAALISSKRIITAAHCLQKTDDPADGQQPIASMNVMADFVHKPGGSPLPVAGSTIRSISKILYCTVNLKTDIAVLELDAPFERMPVRRSQAKLVAWQPVHLVSFPLGLPLSVSTCAGQDAACVQALIASISPTLFRAPLDSFHGSSGGSVLNDAGELIGIFRGGPPQLEKPHPPTLCASELVYGDDCAGEYISRVDGLAAALFDDSKALPQVACTFGGHPSWCVNCAAHPATP